MMNGDRYGQDGMRWGGVGLDLRCSIVGMGIEKKGKAGHRDLVRSQVLRIMNVFDLYNTYVWDVYIWVYKQTKRIQKNIRRYSVSESTSVQTSTSH